MKKNKLVQNSLMHLVRNSNEIPKIYWDGVLWLYGDRSLGMDRNGYFYYINRRRTKHKRPDFSYKESSKDKQNFWNWKIRDYHKYTWNSFFLSNLTNLNHQEILKNIQDISLFVKEDLNGKNIVSCQNQAIKRVLIKRYGFKKLIRDLKGKILHQDGKSELISINVKDEENLVVVKVEDPSTKDIYLLRVPPDMKRCNQAIAWTFQLEEEEYLPLVET